MRILMWCLLLLPLIAQTEPLSLSAQHEMQWLLTDKTQATAEERKLDSGLRLALQRLRGEGTAARLPKLRVMQPDALGRFQLDVHLHRAATLNEVRTWLQDRTDARLQSAVGTELRVWLRWQDIEALAALAAVRSVRRAVPGMSSRAQPNGSAVAKIVNVSEGVQAHRVDVARATFGMTGLGQKICVLSDSLDHLARVQASGDLPAEIEILPGQSGIGEGAIGEGTAMLEIVHDLAPDAELGFASVIFGVAAFAQSVRDLRFNAGCDVLVDDFLYFSEPPFQDGPIAQAVNDVTADGALYFSSAGNSGSVANNTAGVYEGDFIDGGTLPALPGGNVHQFTVPSVGSSNQQRVLSDGFATSLHWTDPLGASGNDYDVFVMSPDLQHVLDASFDVQDGDDDPFEITGRIFPNDRVVVFKSATAAPRHLHLNALRGRFNLATSGQTFGHSAAVDAFSVAAVDVFTASGGAFTGGAANPVESFSSDGPRRMFYAANGTLLNTANPSLLADGGVVRLKPDIAAADGVRTATPGFAQFFGTSAAAPHAAAMAALLLQAAPSEPPMHIRAALNSSALDIEAPGVDTLSGVGIIMADTALTAIGAVPAARLQRTGFNPRVIDGDGDAITEPGETVELDVDLSNVGAALATGVLLTASTTSTGVTWLRSSASYTALAPQATASGLQALRLRIAPDFACGDAIEVQLSAAFAGGSPGINSVTLTTISLPVGVLGTQSDFSYDGVPVNIPDGDTSGVAVPLPVAAAGTRVGELKVRFDGGACSADAFATDVGVQHTFIGDLRVELQSPAGGIVQLVDRPRAGVGDNRGNHLCQTILDDRAELPLSEAFGNQEPFTGSFRAAEGLSGFNGTAADGVWQLRLRDAVTGDSGLLRGFTLSMRPALCDVHVPNLLHLDSFE